MILVDQERRQPAERHRLRLRREQGDAVVEPRRRAARAGRAGHERRHKGVRLRYSASAARSNATRSGSSATRGSGRTRSCWPTSSTRRRPDGVLRQAHRLLRQGDLAGQPQQQDHRSPTAARGSTARIRREGATFVDAGGGELQHAESGQLLLRRHVDGDAVELLDLRGAGLEDEPHQPRALSARGGAERCRRGSTSRPRSSRARRRGSGKAIRSGRSSPGQVTRVGNWFGSHELSAGAQYDWGGYITERAYHGDIYLRFRSGVPDSADLLNSPVTSDNRVRQVGLYVQDRWMIANRLTINAGARFDETYIWIAEQYSPAGRWVPERRTPKTDVKTWRNVVPRLGVAYDLTGKPKTVLKGSFSKYMGNEATGLAETRQPACSSIEQPVRVDRSQRRPLRAGERAQPLHGVERRRERRSSTPICGGRSIANTAWGSSIRSASNLRHRRSCAHRREQRDLRSNHESRRALRQLHPGRHHQPADQPAADDLQPESGDGGPAGQHPDQLVEAGHQLQRRRDLASAPVRRAARSCRAATTTARISAASPPAS